MAMQLSSKKKTRANRALPAVSNVANLAVSPDAVAQRVRERAFKLFEVRGRTHGSDQSDWFQAQSEVQAELNGRAGKSNTNKQR